MGCTKSTKVVPIIKCTCTVFIDNFRNIPTNSLIKVSVCWGSHDGYVKHKTNYPTYDSWDFQGNEKMQFLFLLLSALTFLSEMKISFPTKAKQKVVSNNLACRASYKPSKLDG